MKDIGKRGDQNKSPLDREDDTLPLPPPPMPRGKPLPTWTTPTPVPEFIDPDVFYCGEIQKFPPLEPEEELLLAMRWREHGDRAALDKLVTSFLRLADKYARRIKRRTPQRFQLEELRASGEGAAGGSADGLLAAAKGFNPEEGFKFATYSIPAIKRAIYPYIHSSWSLAKIGISAEEKKLFYALPWEKARLGADGNSDLRPDHARIIAERLGLIGEAPSDEQVKDAVDAVVDMDRRLRSDLSLSVEVRDEDGSCSGTKQDLLVCPDDPFSSANEDN